MNQTESEEPNIRSLTKKATRIRRNSMVIKVLSFNIQYNKLSHDKKNYLNLLKLEAKYYYNYLISLSQTSIMDDFGYSVYPHNLFNFNTKSNLIQIFNMKDKLYYPYDLTVLSSQMKQELLKKITSSIKSISAAKVKGRKTGKLKFKSSVNIPLKQFNKSFNLSDDCRKLSLQGNKKTSFHLIRNKNLSKLYKNLNLTNNSISTSNTSTVDVKPKHNNISLKTLIDLKIIEVANAEIVTNVHDKFSFNLTLYFNPTSLAKANLFQGSKLTKEQIKLVQAIRLGLDAGIASENTVNCGEIYASISIDSRKPILTSIKNKLKALKKYQRQFQRNISKSKKNKRKGRSHRNNEDGFRTNQHYKTKAKIDKLQNNLNNHKLDSVRKLYSLMSLFKGINFQDEMIKSWHSNKKMKFSGVIQRGILGKTYGKLKYHADSKDNKTIINKDGQEKIEYKYKKLSKSLRTTKTCICGKLKHDITLKDRVYRCLVCGYENGRDNHSSYLINNTLNHVDYDEDDLMYVEKELGCGKQSKDLILGPNLGEITTAVRTSHIYEIFSSKLKSQNLTIKLNIYKKDEYLVVKQTQEASSFRAG